MDADGGVPGIQPMLDIIREEICRRGQDQLDRFETTVAGTAGADAYQSAMRWLQGSFTHDAVNSVVERAVLKARRPGASEQFSDIGDVADWYLPAGTRHVARLVTQNRERFPGPILTPNFDPLLSVAVEAERGRAAWHILDLDGYFGRTAAARRGETQIIHLHGYWCGADTLHTPAQLTSDRPKLHASLQHLLRQRTLIVAAYGGWDDSFTNALAKLLTSGHPDDLLGVNVLWCFREDDPALIEAKYKHLFEEMPSSRFLAYGGIDCHSVFAEIGGFPGDGGGYVAPVPNPPPLAGWQTIDSDYIEELVPLTGDELTKFFDGAIPSWRHATSRDIPQREVASEIAARLASFRPATYGASIQLIRAAGGEGKTTLLLQAAATAVSTGDWTVLWRPSSALGLPAQHVLDLDPQKLWLIVADDAENLVDDISTAARLLHEQGRSNVHFLLAARDADWWTSFGDKPPWESWLHAWVRRNQAVMLRGITHREAGMIVAAWEKCGAPGLRKLADLATSADRADALFSHVRNAAQEQEKLLRSDDLEGSLFGGLLTARFGQDGLQAHVRLFLNRLREQTIAGSDRTLFDALVYVAACHAVGIPGIDQNVLADLLAVPRDWIHSLVVRPLGEETAAVHSAGHVMTRHRRVAAAIVAEADQMMDVREVWTALVKQTIRTARDIRVERSFAMVVHAGPRLVDELPEQLSEPRRHEIALAAATAAVTHNPQWLGCVVSLGKTYRKLGRFSDATRLFRDNLAKAATKEDFPSHIRGYWHEWGVSEGLLGREGDHRASDAWLQGLSVSDYLNPSPLTEENVKQSCAGMGIAFGILARTGADCTFNFARRAAAFVGRLAEPDWRTVGYFDRIDREADAADAPIPGDPQEAISWLTRGVVAAAHELQDPLLKDLLRPDEVSFQALSHFARSVVITPEHRPPSEVHRHDDREITTGPVPHSDGPIHLEGSANNPREELRHSVLIVIRELIERSIVRERPLHLPALGKLLNYRFPEHRPVHVSLGFRDLTGLILSFDELAVTGQHPRWIVSFREEWQVTRETGLRFQVMNIVKELIERSAFAKRPLYLTTVGIELAERFPDQRPMHRSLGFESFTDLINSFEDFEVIGEHPRWEVQYHPSQRTAGALDLRTEVAALIGNLIRQHKRVGTPLLLPVVGFRLAATFREAKPIHHTLGFGTLTDLILSFDEFAVSGEHPRWVVHYREQDRAEAGEDLRYEVWTFISDLLDTGNEKMIPLHLPTLGMHLSQRFPGPMHVHRALGFETLSDLVLSYDDFVIVGQHPRWQVQYAERDDSGVRSFTVNDTAFSQELMGIG